MTVDLGRFVADRQADTPGAIKSGERTIFVPVDEVDWIEAFQNYVRLHMGPATHLLHVPMNTIGAVLDSGRFLRIHRSYIVNVQRIAQLWSIAHGQYVIELRSGQRLQSGRPYNEQIRRALTNPFLPFQWRVDLKER